MRRLLTVCAVMAVAACGGPTKPAEGPRKSGVQDEVLDALAREIDPGPQRAIWAQLPADARAKAEIDAPRDKAPAARLAAARERLGKWSLHATSGALDELQATLDRVFEGVYLAEPLALSAENDATALEARALLWRFYRAFALTEAALRSFAATWGVTGTALAKSMVVVEVLKNAGPKVAERYAAEILRARSPEPAVAEIVWTHASEKLARGDAAGGRALTAELIRRTRSSTTLDDQLRVAEAYIRLDDAAAAAEVITRARASVAEDNRNGQARVRYIDRDRAVLARLLALPADTSVSTLLARFDLLMDLNRPKEAEAVLTGLVQQRPDDARVRARSVRLRVRNGDLSTTLVDQLRGDQLTDRDAYYWSMRIGAAGVAGAKSPSLAMLNEVGAAATELAKDQPGRAAALLFIVERVKRLMEKPVDGPAIIASLGPMLDDAVALRAKFPAEPDIDRIAIALSLFAEPAQGLKIALLRPKASPVDEGDLFEQRAATVVTLAAYVGKGADLAAVRAAVEDIAPSANSETEGGREALLGDVDVLAAAQHGDTTAWARAAAHYESAKKLTKNVRARLDNNLAYIAGLAGDDARASTLFDAASREKSGRRWVPLLNLAMVPGTSKEEQLTAVRAIAGPAEAETPALINSWRAALEPGVAEASAAAKSALGDLDSPFTRQRYAASSQGIETEGTFTVNLGVRVGHTLSARAHASLWLVRPAPLTPAELDAKSKKQPPPAGPPKPPPKR